MMVNKFVLGLCMGLSCSIIFSETNILWDFGVVISSPKFKNIPKDIPLQSSTNQKESQVKINPLISDSFISPVNSSISSHVSESVNHGTYLGVLGFKKNIFLINSIHFT